MRIHGSTILIVGVCALAACDRSKNDDYAEGKSVVNTSATVNAAPGGAASADPVSHAVNAATVSRYSDETPLTQVSRIVPRTIVRTMPLGRQVVARVEDGCDATALAKKGDYYLVTFSDPSIPSRQLAGWIYKDALGIVGVVSAVPAAPSSFSCKTGEVDVLADGLCAQRCVHDGDCAPVGGVCDGNGYVATALNMVERAQYCVVPSK